MPASPTDSNATSSTSSAARDRAATEAAATAPSSEATSPAADQARDATQSVSPPTGSGTRSKASDPACPTCRGPLERYLGEAAHKLGSYWCHACGMRQRLPASTAADEAMAPTSTSGTSGTKAAG